MNTRYPRSWYNHRPNHKGVYRDRQFETEYCENCPAVRIHDLRRPYIATSWTVDGLKQRYCLGG